MKYIKHFESFHQSGVDDGSGEVMPDYNPILNQKVKDFVEDLFTKGRYEDCANMIGEKLPKGLESDEMDDYGDKLKSRAIKYFIENPELVSKEIDYQMFKVPGGDGISRTNNIGGVMPRR